MDTLQSLENGTSDLNKNNVIDSSFDMENKLETVILSDEIDNDIQSCMTNLKILSKLNPKDKLYYKNKLFYIHKKTASQSMKRWWANGSRNETIKSLEDFIIKLFHVIDTIYNSEIGKGISNNYYVGGINENSNKLGVFRQENSNILVTFTNEINQCIKGISNLKITYKKDIGIVSSLEIIIEKLSVRSKKISEILRVNNC